MVSQLNYFSYKDVMFTARGLRISLQLESYIITHSASVILNTVILTPSAILD